MISASAGAAVQTSLPLTVSFVLLIAALLFSWWSYRRPWPPVSGSVRWILTALRASALMMVILFLTRAAIEIDTEREQKPRLAVLVDRSQSMGIARSEDDRPETVRRLLTGSAVSELRRRYDLVFFPFSDSLLSDRPTEEPGWASPPAGVGSNLTRAWQDALSDASPPFDGVILVSDGQHNSGTEPARASKFAPTPIWVVGVGSPEVPPDVMVTEVQVNPVVYLNHTIPVEIAYRAVGAAGAQAMIALSDPTGAVVAQKAIPLSQGFSEGRVSLPLTVSRIGRLRYIASISTTGEELFNANNRRSFFVNVLSQKMKLLLMAGPPDNGLGDLIRRLRSDEHLDITLRTVRGRGFYEGDWPSDDEIGAADLIILHHFPSSTVDGQELAGFAQSVLKKSVPVCFMDGGQIDRNKLKGLSALLPVAVLDGASRTSEGLMKPVERHAIIAEPEVSDWVNQWSGLPPLTFNAAGYRPHPAANTLARFQSVGSLESASAIVVSDVEGRKSAAVLARDLWRWGLASPPDEAMLESLYGRMVRWLAIRKADKRVSLTIARDIFSNQEQVQFSATVLDENLKPVDGAVVNAEIQKGDTTRTSVMMEGRGKGAYSAEFHPWGDGEYSITISAELEGNRLGGDKGVVVIEPFNIELLQTSLSEGVLRSIAENSGGGYAHIERADSLLRSIDLPLSVQLVKRRFEFWGHWWLLACVVALLSAEWVIRVRNGML